MVALNIVAVTGRQSCREIFDARDRRRRASENKKVRLHDGRSDPGNHEIVGSGDSRQDKATMRLSVFLGCCKNLGRHEIIDSWANCHEPRRK